MTYPLYVLLLLNYFAYVSTPLLYLYSLIFETWRYHPYKLLWVSISWFNSQSRHGLAISPIIVWYELCHLVKSLYWMYLVVNRPVLNYTSLFLVFDNCHNCIFFLLLSLLSVFILVILLVHLLCFLFLIVFFLLLLLSSISFSLSLCGQGSN